MMRIDGWMENRGNEKVEERSNRNEIVKSIETIPFEMERYQF